VILGAGFDCRAYRLEGIGAAKVYEVDHPATLRLKLERLREVLPALPGNVRYVEIDFNRQSLRQRLREAGFDTSLPALFLWEGVTNYLTAEAVDSVLRYVLSCAARSQIVFTYVHAGILDGSVRFEGAEMVMRDVKGLGEPWTFGLDPAEIAGFLRERGLELDCDASAREYRQRYFGKESERMTGYEFYHVAVAHVEREEKGFDAEGAEDAESAEKRNPGPTRNCGAWGTRLIKNERAGITAEDGAERGTSA
jgi:methyltransferase (TIGR00027 family)